MTRTELLQEIRIMRFEETYAHWNEGRFTQEEAARILGVHERSFRLKPHNVDMMLVHLKGTWSQYKQRWPAGVVRINDSQVDEKKS